MAIYHYSAQMIGRSAGRSAVAAAAYRAGETIINDRDGVMHDYARRSGVVYTNICAPENVPEWVQDRALLWNRVEQVEIRKDATLAREINVALPVEMSREQHIELLNDYVRDSFVSRGMIADVAIHDKSDGNPHAHIMLTTRDISPEGFGKKNRDWNPEFGGKNFIKSAIQCVDWRANWAAHTNAALAKMGAADRIDHRSYAAQESSLIPTVHEGHERPLSVVKSNEEARTDNREIAEAMRELDRIEKEINVIVETPAASRRATVDHIFQGNTGREKTDDAGDVTSARLETIRNRIQGIITGLPGDAGRIENPLQANSSTAERDIQNAGRVFGDGTTDRLFEDGDHRNGEEGTGGLFVNIGPYEIGNNGGKRQAEGSSGRINQGGKQISEDADGYDRLRRELYKQNDGQLHAPDREIGSGAGEAGHALARETQEVGADGSSRRGDIHRGDGRGIAPEAVGNPLRLIPLMDRERIRAIARGDLAAAAQGELCRELYDIGKLLPVRGHLEYATLSPEGQRKVDNVVLDLMHSTTTAEHFNQYIKTWINEIVEKPKTNDMAREFIQKRETMMDELWAKLNKEIIGAAAAYQTDLAKVDVQLRQSEILDKGMEYQVSKESTDRVKKYITDSTGSADGKENTLKEAAGMMRGARLQLERAVRCASVAGVEKELIAANVQYWLDHEYRRINEVSRHASIALAMDKDNVQDVICRTLGYGRPGAYATQHDTDTFIDKSLERKFDFRDWKAIESSIDTATQGSATPRNEVRLEVGADNAIAAVNGLVRAASSAINSDREHVISWANEAWDKVHGNKERHKNHEKGIEL